MVLFLRFKQQNIINYAFIFIELRIKKNNWHKMMFDFFFENLKKRSEYLSSTF